MDGWTASTSGSPGFVGLQLHKEVLTTNMCVFVGSMFTRRLISSFLILSIPVFPAAGFWKNLNSVFVNSCRSLLAMVPFSLC